VNAGAAVLSTKELGGPIACTKDNTGNVNCRYVNGGAPGFAAVLKEVE
jgi:hypothetical protein